MAEWVAEQGQLLLALLEEHQYLALALAVGLEGAGVPLPISAEVVVVTMGFQVYRGEANPWAVMGTVVASATVGVSVQYWIARGIGRPLLDRYGRILRIRPTHLERLERWFARRAFPVVVIGRVVPAIRIIIPVVAGVARGDFRRFVPAAAAGISLWAPLYMGIGWAFGETVEQVLTTVLSDPSPAVIAAAGVGGLAVVALAIRFRRRLAPLVARPAARLTERIGRRG
ncbi:MAG: DedA family protein [Chloroflexi bacterium]|nr:DedA family protein [Chloroflexota bacterium]